MIIYLIISNKNLNNKNKKKKNDVIFVCKPDMFFTFKGYFLLKENLRGIKKPNIRRVLYAHLSHYFGRHKISGRP